MKMRKIGKKPLNIKGNNKHVEVPKKKSQSS